MQYYLDFVDGEKRKIAYATSLGDLPVQPPQDYLDRIPRYLDCFHAISVREGDSVRTLRERYHISATHLVDPVFLTSMEDWNRLTQKASPMPDGMLTYFLDITESYGQACAAISRELALPSAHLLDPSGDMELKKQYFPEGRVPCGSHYLRMGARISGLQMCDYRLISRDMLRHYLQQALFVHQKRAKRSNPLHIPAKAIRPGRPSHSFP